ncbi:SRPBCC family protein [Hamadaea tsunoensis]|uniref:SRPBCC family protein n=1 Tax=Hamadaea tsunoensis TaxID=53368 RepID=UPI0003F9C860|nr:SRPBCC family protein [Hamadaea tsunoensis]
MIVVEHDTTYLSDPETVVAALTDLAGYPAWQKDVLEVSGLDTAPVGIGTRLIQTRKVMGRRTEVALTVTDYAPGERITLRTDPGAQPAVTQAYAVGPDGAHGSRLTFRLELDGVPKLAEHLVKAQLGKQVPDMFQRLGDLLSARG